LNDSQTPKDREICHRLAEEIDCHIPEAENEVWQAHPDWFLSDHPIVGYNKLKDSIRLLFWSWQSFTEVYRMDT
jgi:hypothetical protein